jgi:hypothetical protein
MTAIRKYIIVISPQYWLLPRTALSKINAICNKKQKWNAIIVSEFLPQYERGTDNGLNCSVDLNNSKIPKPEQQLAVMNQIVSMISLLVKFPLIKLKI